MFAEVKANEGKSFFLGDDRLGLVGNRCMLRTFATKIVSCLLHIMYPVAILCRAATPHSDHHWLASSTRILRLCNALSRLGAARAGRWSTGVARSCLSLSLLPRHPLWLRKRFPDGYGRSNYAKGLICGLLFPYGVIGPGFTAMSCTVRCLLCRFCPCILVLFRLLHVESSPR